MYMMVAASYRQKGQFRMKSKLITVYDIDKEASSLIKQGNKCILSKQAGCSVLIRDIVPDPINDRFVRKPSIEITINKRPEPAI